MKIVKETVNYESDFSTIEPWTRFCKILEKVFESDPSVEVNYELDNTEDLECYVSSDNYSKLIAIRNIIGTHRKFNTTELNIEYICRGNDLDISSWQVAFEDNSKFVDIVPDSEDGNRMFAVFGKEILTIEDGNVNTHNHSTNIILADAIKEVALKSNVIPSTT